MNMKREWLLLLAGAGCFALLNGCDTPSPVQPDNAAQAAAQTAGQTPGPATSQATSGPVSLGPGIATIDLSKVDDAPPPAQGGTQPAGLMYGPVAGGSDSAAAKTGPVTARADEQPNKLQPADRIADQGPDRPLTTEQRVTALETQIAEMHHTLDQMMPALTRLSLAQQDLQSVLERIHAEGRPQSPTVSKTHSVKASLKPANGNLAHAPEAKDDRPKSTMMPPQTLATTPVPADESGTRKAQDVIANAAAGNDDQAEDAGTADKEASAAPKSGEAAGPAPKDVDVTLAPSAVPAASGHSAYAVNQIRFGDHGNMTRMVLDLSGHATYTYHMDASGMLMTVHLPQTAWKTGAGAAAANSRTVASYTATPDGQGGYVLAVKFKRPASVSWSDTLPPSGDGGYRAVLDLTPKG